MNDIGFNKLRNDVEKLKRRVSDHDLLHEESRKDIVMLQSIAKSNEEILTTVKTLAEYAEKTYAVFEPMARYGAMLLKLGAVFVALWHGVKWVYTKFVFFS